MKGLIFVGMILATVSCSHSIWKVDECKNYRKMIQVNWLQDSVGVYYFKGHAYPTEWKRTDYQKYFKENCLVGLPQKEIIKLFGIPTKTHSDTTMHLYIYCMDTTCLSRKIYGRAALYFDFKNGVVNSMFTSPSPEY
jgi:uncharacterized integral membrane protein